MCPEDLRPPVRRRCHRCLCERAPRRLVERGELERQQFPDPFLAGDRRIAQSFDKRPRDRRVHRRDGVRLDRRCRGVPDVRRRRVGTGNGNGVVHHLRRQRDASADLEERLRRVRQPAYVPAMRRPRPGARIAVPYLRRRGPQGLAAAARGRDPTGDPRRPDDQAARARTCRVPRR